MHLSFIGGTGRRSDFLRSLFPNCEAVAAGALPLKTVYNLPAIDTGYDNWNGGTTIWTIYLLIYLVCILASARSRVSCVYACIRTMPNFSAAPTAIAFVGHFSASNHLIAIPCGRLVAMAVLKSRLNR
jgi:hypothetical protein